MPSASISKYPNDRLISMLLSIVVVSFNNDAALERTLKSIDFSSIDKTIYEIIVIDGGNGHAYKRARHFVLTQKLTIIKESDQGIFDAMNKGFAISKGEWVTFLNAGDIYNPNFKLDFIMCDLQESSSMWAVGNAQIYKNGKLKDWLPSQLNNFRFQLGVNSYPHQATFYRREKIQTLLNQPFCAVDSVADWSLSYTLLLKQQPHLLEFFVSINEEAGESQNTPVLTWSRDIVKTRQHLEKLITKSFFADFALQVAIGTVSRVKNKYSC